MADWWPFDRSLADELKRNWTEVLKMSSAAAQSLGLPQPGFLPGDPFGMIVDAARAWLVGKQRTLRFAGHELTMVLTDISVEGSDLARAVGQYGQVRITARDVRWGGHQFERLEVRARNVHLRPGTRPVLVVAPVLVEAFVAVPVASRWLAAVSSRLELTVKAGIPQIGLIGAPWVRLEVEAGAGGGSRRLRGAGHAGRVAALGGPRRHRAAAGRHARRHRPARPLIPRVSRSASRSAQVTRLTAAPATRQPAVTNGRAAASGMCNPQRRQGDHHGR